MWKSRHVTRCEIGCKEVSRCCSTKKQIRDLALILDISCPSPGADEVDASQVLQLLKEWLKKSEKNAVVAVLTDALQDCDLGKVIRNCFGDLGKDTLFQALQTLQSSRVCKLNNEEGSCFMCFFRCHFFIQ